MNKELNRQVEKARKASLAGLGYAIVAQRKLEQLARSLMGKGKLQRFELRARARKIADEALKEQKIAQKRIEAETSKVLAMVARESKKQLSKLESKLDEAGRKAGKKRR